MVEWVERTLMPAIGAQARRPPTCSAVSHLTCCCAFVHFSSPRPEMLSSMRGEPAATASPKSVKCYTGARGKGFRFFSQTQEPRT